MMFVGEEILHSARVWTHGYDIFAPDENLVSSPGSILVLAPAGLVTTMHNLSSTPSHPSWSSHEHRRSAPDWAGLPLCA